MKRSEMIKLLAKAPRITGEWPDELCSVIAEELLTLIEKAGMLPPPIMPEGADSLTASCAYLQASWEPEKLKE